MEKLKGNHIYTTLCTISLTDLRSLYCFLRDDLYSYLYDTEILTLNWLFFKVLFWNSNCICKVCSKGHQVCLMSFMSFRYLDEECIFSMYHFVYLTFIIVTLHRVVYKYLCVCMCLDSGQHRCLHVVAEMFL